MKQVVINNEYFNVKQTDNSIGTPAYRGLYDCYCKPSIYKRDIWEYWNNWALHFDLVIDDKPMYVGMPRINSYNSQMFTLWFTVYDYGTCEAIGYIYVTKTRQELVLKASYYEWV